MGPPYDSLRCFASIFRTLPAFLGRPFPLDAAEPGAQQRAAAVGQLWQARDVLAPSMFTAYLLKVRSSSLCYPTVSSLAQQSSASSRPVQSCSGLPGSASTAAVERLNPLSIRLHDDGVCPVVGNSAYIKLLLHNGYVLLYTRADS